LGRDFGFCVRYKILFFLLFTKQKTIAKKQKVVSLQIFATDFSIFFPQLVVASSQQLNDFPESKKQNRSELQNLKLRLAAAKPF